jgi:hypothetical protein
MIKTADVGHTNADSLEHAHRMIKTLSDHLTKMQARLDRHESLHKSHGMRLDHHDAAHAEHSRIHGEHAERIAKLEAGAGHPSDPPVYKLRSDQLAEARRFFNKPS